MTPRQYPDPFGIGQRAYHRIHDRVRAVKGPARKHICVACGDRPAAEWALRPDPLGHPQPVRGKTGVLYFSKLVEDYIPLCVPHHRQMDGFIRRDLEAELDWVDPTGREGDAWSPRDLCQEHLDSGVRDLLERERWW